MNNKPLESDWKTFQKRVPEWRERYLERLNSEIIAILGKNEGTPTERFWEAKKQIGKEAKKLVSCFDGHSRSSMNFFLVLMLQNQVIDNADLTEFSQDVQQRMRAAKS